MRFMLEPVIEDFIKKKSSLTQIISIQHLQHFSADDHVGVALDENVETFLSLAFKIGSMQYVGVEQHVITNLQRTGGPKYKYYKY